MTDRDVAIAVAEAGADVVHRRFGTELQRSDKGGGDFATNADIEAEQAMLAVLRTARPNDAVVGEESGRSGDARATRRWLIDPLCGTLNYAAGMRVVAVNVALREGDRYVAAAVADPFGGEIYWTDMSAARVRRDREDRPLVPAAHSQLVDLNFDGPLLNAPAFSAFALAGHPRFIERFKPRVVSSSIALAWVATGQRAAYITDGDVAESVHMAAGIALCQAAGCVVTDVFGGEVGRRPTGLLAAANRDTHDALLSMIRPGRS